ncbi:MULTISPECIES: distal tail protein Dit [unclassified Paenibacillus]|uniref:distal tail protein Dit n=1 Tax=unclassified Paenibacillus TaxID=185978 RepID=UPI0009A66B8D|nr:MULTISPECIES: distal tail protein Dit [unclassified Paenibacillus]SLJ98103.1 putative phage tail component, N-terminal domain-containing protein [Paenibacillus sp. RU5A]SOC66817.1 putative phage tail component, N-terminal domain-containing protein [Paenibacillus sp. RU26A]SOC70034.1 putative phage tail component, N-terminal domain-containing protein [Paenibacillus sp. RU5M]
MDYDVKVNGVWVSTVGAILVGRTLPPLPEAEENTVKLTGRDGELDFGSTYNTRPLELSFYVMGDLSDYHPTINRLANIFHAQRGDLELIFSDRPERRYMAQYRGTMDYDQSSVNHQVNVPLKMYDPFPESSEDFVFEITLSNATETINIKSAGDIPAPPRMVLTNVGSTTIRSLRLTNEYLLEG